LPNVEEVNNTADLVLGHVWGQHETLQTESVQEKLNPVCLDDVVTQNHCLALHDCQLDEGEEQNELVQVLFAHYIQVVNAFEETLTLVDVVAQFDN